MIGNKPVVFNGLFVAAEPFPGQLLPLCARTAVVGVRVDGNAAAGSKESGNFNVLGIHQFDEVLHNCVHAVLVEISV